MKCKSCGGELLYKNGLYLCNSCGTTFALDSIYENIDVCICYEENDTAGRRTRDSIIAQEVYRKLEESKIATFYERVSADGMTGNDLEMSKLAAINKAKTIIVLGTSIENFRAIETKYSECFSGKPVIPFCVDVNPGAIPKTLSKIQAMSYSTIGWDKDLIKGVYNILGREQIVDTTSLYRQRKGKIIIGIIAVLITLAVALTIWFLVKPGNSATEDTNMGTTNSLTQKEIYDKASGLLEQGDYIEALDLFLQIPEHSNSANMLKKIYSQYEGYYQKDGFTLHMNITDNIRADVEVSIASEGNNAQFTTSTAVNGSLIEGNYQDNLQQTGKFTIKLENTGMKFSYTIDNTKKTVDLFLNFSEKTDQPTDTITAETILSWFKKQHTLSQLMTMGYELEQTEVFDRAGANRMYQIKDTDIYLAVFGFMVTEDGCGDTFDDIVVAIQAPAELLMPSYIGKSDIPVFDGNLLYWPYGNPGGDAYLNFNYTPSGQTISKSTPIGLTSKAILTTGMWNQLMLDIAQITVENQAKSKYKLESTSVDTVTENNTHILLSAEITNDRRAWYKYEKKNQKVTFIKDGSYQVEGYKISKALWFSEYLDFALEFPNTFDIKPGTPEWDEKVKDVLEDKAMDAVCQKFNLDPYEGIEYVMQAENESYLLYAFRTSDKTCAWYKCGKKDGKVLFVKEGPTESEFMGYLSEEFWTSQYSDFAKEFPNAFD